MTALGPPRAALQRRKAACSVGWTSSRPRSTAAGTLQLGVRSSATPSSLFKSNVQIKFVQIKFQIKFPRWSPGRRITPEAQALASRPPTAGRASDDRCAKPRILFRSFLALHPSKIPPNRIYIQKCNEKICISKFYNNIYII